MLFWLLNDFSIVLQNQSLIWTSHFVYPCHPWERNAMKASSHQSSGATGSVWLLETDTDFICICLFICICFYKPKFVSVTRGAFSERVWMILPMSWGVRPAAAQHLKLTVTFWAEGKLHNKGRMENTSYVFTRTWSGRAEHSLRSVRWSRQRLALHFSLGMTGLGWLWVCCSTWFPQSLLWLAAERGGHFWEAFYPASFGKMLHSRGSRMSCRHSKTTSKGCQPLLAGWVGGKVKNYISCMQTPNPRTHCFMEQEAKQLALMTECKERGK